MAPARISLADDRRGLSGLAFRSGNRLTYLGSDGEARDWRVELLVAPTDELQLVETAESRAKPVLGELFDALELISRPGRQTHAVTADFALTGASWRR